MLAWLRGNGKLGAWNDLTPTSFAVLKTCLPHIASSAGSTETSATTTNTAFVRTVLYAIARIANCAGLKARAQTGLGPYTRLYWLLASKHVDTAEKPNLSTVSTLMVVLRTAQKSTEAAVKRACWTLQSSNSLRCTDQKLNGGRPILKILSLASLTTQQSVNSISALIWTWGTSCICTRSNADCAPCLESR